MTEPTTALALLRDTERLLSALHGSVARHDQLAANLGCAGCELRDRITAALPDLSNEQPTGAEWASLSRETDRLRRDWVEMRNRAECIEAEVKRLRADRAAVRAEVLREAADIVGNDDTCDCGGCDSCVPNARAAELRRMADETAATETEQCPRSKFDWYGLRCQKPAGHNLCTFEEEPAAGARQDGAQR